MNGAQGMGGLFGFFVGLVFVFVWDVGGWGVAGVVGFAGTDFGVGIVGEFDRDAVQAGGDRFAVFALRLEA
jgi:hypothetical protein